MMTYRISQLIMLIIAGMAVSVSAQSGAGDMAFIEGGEYLPFYNFSEDSVYVEPFYLDKYPVTNAEYLEFVIANPEWRRSQVKKIFADSGYLKKWSEDLDLGPNADKIKNSPVTNVSWFAARAYAKWKGKRLPTLDEWEYAASASKDKPMAARDEMFVQTIMDWYSQPNPAILPAVGDNDANYYGVHDLHGLIWSGCWILIRFLSVENRVPTREISNSFSVQQGVQPLRMQTRETMPLF